jgi:hypothetical protein
MKISNKLFLLTVLLSCVSLNTFAYDIAVENSDGKIIYYNYINGWAELEVAGLYNYYNSQNPSAYSGTIIIPEKVTVPNGTRKVTGIGNYAFAGCSSLTSITIPKSVTSIGRDAFFYCTGLTSITIPNSVTSIGNGAFAGCSSLTSITIPNSVTSIGNEAFLSCSGLTSITIPNSVTTIGSASFSGCSGLTSVIIPNSVTTIGSAAFRNCKGLTSITIPNSVTSIGDGAFSLCSGLNSVTIPNSVTRIGIEAFSDCSGLTSITIPNSVTSIGDWAFYGVDLTSVTSEIENPFDIYSGTFSANTFMNATLYVPAGTIDKYKSTEGWRNFFSIKEKGVSDGIEVIDESLSGSIDNSPAYNIRGQRVSKPAKGLFIHKGKKVLMK